MAASLPHTGWAKMAASAAATDGDDDQTASPPKRRLRNRKIAPTKAMRSAYKITLPR
jgi:hypothetical protein